ncbi:MAG TPA: Uma2 family endonuclease [Pyrinomonadaceae bacterium]|nr:Uma2 family endonuclease [Pyrinomonadaceae bacterium]
MSLVLSPPLKKVRKGISPETVKAIARFVVENEESEGVVLQNVAWKTYQRILQDLEGVNNPRFFYNKGELLVMPNSPEHEEIKDTIVYFINILCEELEVESRSFGSTTYQRADLKRGFEPDSCFYFGENEAKMRGVKRLDMSRFSAPDLVIEIDITSSSFDRLGIFAAFGVREIWRFDGEILEIGLLENGVYLKSETSEILKGVNAEKLTEFIKSSAKLSRLEWQKNVRDWAREKK